MLVFDFDCPECNKMFCIQVSGEPEDFEDEGRYKRIDGVLYRECPHCGHLDEELESKSTSIAEKHKVHLVKIKQPTYDTKIIGGQF